MITEAVFHYSCFFHKIPLITPVKSISCDSTFTVKQLIQLIKTDLENSNISTNRDLYIYSWSKKKILRKDDMIMQWFGEEVQSKSQIEILISNINHDPPLLSQYERVYTVIRLSESIGRNAQHITNIPQKEVYDSADFSEGYSSLIPSSLERILFAEELDSISYRFKNEQLMKIVTFCEDYQAKPHHMELDKFLYRGYKVALTLVEFMLSLDDAVKQKVHFQNEYQICVPQTVRDANERLPSYLQITLPEARVAQGAILCSEDEIPIFIILWANTSLQSAKGKSFDQLFTCAAYHGKKNVYGIITQADRWVITKCDLTSKRVFYASSLLDCVEMKETDEKHVIRVKIDQPELLRLFGWILGIIAG